LIYPAVAERRKRRMRGHTGKKTTERGQIFKKGD